MPRRRRSAVASSTVGTPRDVPATVDLHARGDLHAELPSMRAVGYRQAWAALDANDLSSLPATGGAATRQLAKRQLTWLRAMPHRQVVAADAPDAVEQVVRLARRLLAL